MNGDGRFHVVVEEDPPVLEQETPDAEAEKRLVPRPLRRSGPHRSWHVGGSVFADKDMHMRLLHQELIQRNAPAPKRINPQRSLNFVR